MSEKALEYAERAEEKDNYDKLKTELGLRFNIKDAPVAARQKLHVIKQTEEEGLEEFLQRVLTTAMDGFHVADNTTVQKLATEAFLRGCRHKEAASLTLNQNPMSIQEACRSVKTILANKKAIFGNKVTFQERYFTAQEEERVSNIERKVYNLDRDFRGASISPSRDSHYTSPHRRDSPYPSPPGHSYNDSRPSNVRDDQEGMQLRGRPRMRDYRPYQGRPEYGSRPGHSPGMERNYRDRYYSPGYSCSPNYRYSGRNLSPYRERYYNGGDRDKYSHRSDHGRPSSYDKPVHIPTQNYRGTTSSSYGRPNRDDSHYRGRSVHSNSNVGGNDFPRRQDYGKNASYNSESYTLVVTIEKVIKTENSLEALREMRAVQGAIRQIKVQTQTEI